MKAATKPFRCVAITGASGSLGEAIVSILLKDPVIEKIRALDLVRPHRHKIGGKLEFQTCDVRNKDFERHLEGCDALLHLAFVVEKRGRKSEQEIDEINVGGTKNVIEAAAKAGIKQIVYASSVASYGLDPANDTRVITEDMPIREETDFYYFRTKAQVEKWLDVFEAGHPDIAIARLRPTIFLSEHSEARNVKSAFISPVIPTISGAKAKIQLTHEDDVAEAFVLALKNRSRGAYNVGAEGGLTLPELAKAMGKWSLPLPKASLALVWLGFKFGISPLDPAWLTRTMNRTVLVSGKKLRDELGWNPRYKTTAEVIRVMVRK